LRELWPEYQALSDLETAGIGCGLWIFRLGYVVNLWNS